jgi:hypothetical protein
LETQTKTGRLRETLLALAAGTYDGTMGTGTAAGVALRAFAVVRTQSLDALAASRYLQPVAFTRSEERIRVAAQRHSVME